MRPFCRRILIALLRSCFRASMWLYGCEGANLWLRVLPCQAIAPLLESYGARIGGHVRFHAPLVIHNGAVGPVPYRKLAVGSNCYLGRDLLLDLQGQITIEDNVTISLGVRIFTHTNVGDSPLAKMGFPNSQEPVRLRRGAYVGANALILQGVEVGECAVVAAGAVVTGSVPAYTVAAGVPARPVRSLAPGIGAASTVASWRCSE